MSRNNFILGSVVLTKTSDGWSDGRNTMCSYGMGEFFEGMHYRYPIGTKIQFTLQTENSEQALPVKDIKGNAWDFYFFNGEHWVLSGPFGKSKTLMKRAFRIVKQDTLYITAQEV